MYYSWPMCWWEEILESSRVSFTHIPHPNPLPPHTPVQIYNLWWVMWFVLKQQYQVGIWGETVWILPQLMYSRDWESWDVCDFGALHPAKVYKMHLEIELAGENWPVARYPLPERCLRDMSTQRLGTLAFEWVKKSIKIWSNRDKMLHRSFAAL